MLPIEIALHSNPWHDTVPNGELYELVRLTAESRAKHVEKMYEDGEGEWTRCCLGLTLMVPNAPSNWTARDAVLATVCIGEDGDDYVVKDFVVNSVAKACYHHDHGHPAGYGRYVDLAASVDGDFCYGFSAKVDGMIAGASALKEIQDACEAAHAATTFLYYLRYARGTWLENRPSRPHWFSADDKPNLLYQNIADDPSIYTPA